MLFVCLFFVARLYPRDCYDRGKGGSVRGREGGHVEEWVRLEISDTLSGMPKKLYDLIYKRSLAVKAMNYVSEI